MTRVKLEEYIRNEAGKLGFGAIGFAAAGTSLSLSIFQEWLDKGYGAEMNYLRRHAALRADPRNLLTSAKTVIVVGARYPSTSQNAGIEISRYALGLDYHDVLRAKLARLASALEGEYGGKIESRICVDSAPLAEREWAVRAGIGWIGKQGGVISPDIGACFFLGELLVNLDLEPSAQIADRCGDCNLCVEACPNRAISAEKRIDARRCISYLTIEQKKDFSLDTAALINRSVFGCDRCTAVCPWNRQAKAPVMREFCGDGKQLPSMEECLTLDRKNFEKYFANTPVERVGLERFKRNVNTAIGNRKQDLTACCARGAENAEEKTDNLNSATSASRR